MRIAALCCYPVKSCAAVALAEVALESTGLRGDRAFAVLGEDGRALTQREAPLLATIRARLLGARLELDFGGIERLALERIDFRASRRARVWGRTLEAHAAPDAASRALEAYLGRRAELVALAPAAAHSLADAEPLLVVTLATLEALNARLAEPVGIERFRANVVLEGARAFAERDWRAIAVGEARLECVSPCERCEVTTIDQASGTRRGPEPLATLEAQMRLEFGVYCRVARAGVLRVGETATAH